MRKHIERLKTQHPAVRARAALMAAAGVTAVVAFVWLTTLPVRFGTGSDVSTNPADTQTANVISAFGETIAPNLTDAQNAYKTVQTNVKGLQIAPNPDNTRSSADQSSVGADTSADSQANF